MCSIQQADSPCHLIPSSPHAFRQHGPCRRVGNKLHPAGFNPFTFGLGPHCGFLWTTLHGLPSLTPR